MFKSTWTASNPANGAWPYLMKYLPVLNTWDSCSGNTCKCGDTGRVEMIDTYFGIHTVLAAGLDNARASKPFTGKLSVAEVEAVFDEQLGNMSVYSPWMDYNVALWAPRGTLDAFVALLEQDHVPVLKLSWLSKACRPACFSVIWHIPHSQVVIELISNQTNIPPAQWQHIREERHVFPSGNPPESSYMKPLHDSRAVSNVSEVIQFYDQILDVKPLEVKRHPDGALIASFAFPTEADFHQNATVQYVERPVASGSLGSVKFSTAWFESYLRTNAEKYMTGSSKACWPIWGDNHIGLSTTTTIDVVIGRLTTHGWHTYKTFIGQENGVPGFGHTNLYLLEPSGWQIELKAPYLQPPNGTDIDIGDFDEYCGYHCGDDHSDFQPIWL